MSVYLDDLSDRELLEMQASLLTMRRRVPLHLMRPWAAMLNELTRRTQARGLFDERTGQLTDSGRRVAGTDRR